MEYLEGGSGKGADSESHHVSRRRLLSGALKAAAGAGLIGVGLSCGAKGSRESKYPWPYKKIDPSRAASIAYENWYKSYCSYAAISGILVPLQESVGEPYSLLPLEAFAFGHGGTVGWGTLCGTLFGSNIAVSLAAGPEGEKIINDMMQWYSGTVLPIYVPDRPKATFKNTNMSYSPLCHISVGRWMKKEGVGFNSPQRRDRCARLAASVAAESVRRLNEWADKKYTAIHGSQADIYGLPAQNNCGDCHTKT